VAGLTQNDTLSSVFLRCQGFHMELLGVLSGEAVCMVLVDGYNDNRGGQNTHPSALVCAALCSKKHTL